LEDTDVAAAVAVTAEAAVAATRPPHLSTSLFLYSFFFSFVITM
jgi:hypothetical protein